MENRFEPLDGDEVLSVDESAQIFIGHRTFRVSEIATALKTQLLEYGLGGITAEKEGWFNPEGISCEALKFGANRWLKGRVKISIDFCPDEIQGLAKSPAPASTPATSSAPVTPPPVLEEDELVIAMPEPSPVLAPDPVVAPPEPIVDEPQSSSDELELTAHDEDDLFGSTADAPDELEEELDFGESLDLEASGDVEQAAADFWSDDDDDDDFAVGPDESSDEEDFFGSELDEEEPTAIAPPEPEATDDEDDVFGELADDGEDDIFGDDDDDADALVDDVFADAPVDLDSDDSDDADALVDDVFADAPMDLDSDGDDEFDLGGDLFGAEETPTAAEDDDPFGELGNDDSLFDVSDEDELEASSDAANTAAEVVLEDADDIFGDDDTDWGLSGDDDDDLDFGDLDTATSSGQSGQEDDVIADIWQDIDELS